MGNKNRYTPALLFAALLINAGKVTAEEVDRVRLNLDTPFIHRNVLRTRLQAGNGNPLDCTNNSNPLDFVSSDREILPAHQVFDRNSKDRILKRLLHSVLEETCRPTAVDSGSLVPEKN